MRLRLGHLDYLNALPLYTALVRGAVPCSAELFPGNPSELNGRLADGQLDVSLVSSFEYLRHAERYYLLPSLCIAAKRQVLSVNLYVSCEVAALDGKRIALTPQSASSTQLVKLLCAFYWKIAPHFVSLPSLESASDFPAFMLIGDQALTHREYRGYHCLDLAAQWYEWTHLPMTFALFAARKEVMETRGDEVLALALALQQSVSWAEDAREAIIEEAMERSSVPRKLLERYYGLLIYRACEEEKRALEQFASLSQELDARATVS